MEILVTESDMGAADRTVERLVRAGHTVHRCHEQGQRAFPCAAVTGTCPLDAAPIDAVLAVRERTRTWPTPYEDGVTCGLRRRIPVLVTGRTSFNPFVDYGAVVVDGDPVEACEAAVGELAIHGELATTALRETLVGAGLPAASARAHVARREGRLRVELDVPDGTSAAVCRTAEVRVIGALRAYDRAAGGIDVGTRTPTGSSV